MNGRRRILAYILDRYIYIRRAWYIVHLPLFSAKILVQETEIKEQVKGENVNTRKFL